MLQAGCHLEACSQRIVHTLRRPPVVLISSCIDDKLRQTMAHTIARLGGRLTTSAKDFTVFITLGAARGSADRGFVKSLNSLSALASGERQLWPAPRPLKVCQGCGGDERPTRVLGPMLQMANGLRICQKCNLGSIEGHCWLTLHITGSARGCGLGCCTTCLPDPRGADRV